MPVGVKMKGDAAYFSRRAAQEREAAMRAALPSARQAHLELAARYDDLSSAITEREMHLGLDPGAPTAA